MPGKLYPILYSNPNETIKLVDKLWGKFVSTKQEATLSIFKSNHDDYLSFKLYPTIANNEIKSINFHSFINVLHGNQETDYIKILFDELLEYII